MCLCCDVHAHRNAFTHIASTQTHSNNTEAERYSVFFSMSSFFPYIRSMMCCCIGVTSDNFHTQTSTHTHIHSHTFEKHYPHKFNTNCIDYRFTHKHRKKKTKKRADIVCEYGVVSEEQNAHSRKPTQSQISLYCIGASLTICIRIVFVCQRIQTKDGIENGKKTT